MRNLLLIILFFLGLGQAAWASNQAASFFAYIYGQNPTCPNFNNGKADVIVFGTVAPVTYLWSNGATTDSLRNLSQGTYNVTITDATGFSLVETITLSNISGLYPAINIIRQPSCPNFNNGEVSIYNVFGGTPPYSYQWSNGATTNGISNLSAGTYSLTATDANGCVGETDFVLLDGSGFATISTVQYASCPNFNNGILEVDAVYNLTPPLTYLWSNGATTQRINNLTEGTYDVTVTDVYGCTGTQSGYIYNAGIYAFINTLQSPTCPNYNNGSLDNSPLKKTKNKKEQ